MTYGIVERAALIALMARQGEAANAELTGRFRISLKKASRIKLEKAGLLVTRMEGRQIVLELTEKGWFWVDAELSAPPPARAGAMGGALHALMNMLGTALEARETSLAAFLSYAPPPKPPLPKERDPVRIIAGLAARPGGWVELRDLRPRLPGARAEQDALLKDFGMKSASTSPCARIRAA